MNGDTEEKLPIVPSRGIVFKVIWNDLGRKKVPTVSLAAGSRLTQNDTAVAIYKQLEDSKDGRLSISSVPSAGGTDPAYIIKSFNGSRAGLEESVVTWNTSASSSARSLWVLKDGLMSDYGLGEMSDLLALFMQGGVHRGELGPSR